MFKHSSWYNEWYNCGELRSMTSAANYKYWPTCSSSKSLFLFSYFMLVVRSFIKSQFRSESQFKDNANSEQMMKLNGNHAKLHTHTHMHTTKINVIHWCREYFFCSPETTVYFIPALSSSPCGRVWKINDSNEVPLSNIPIQWRQFQCLLLR